MNLPRVRNFNFSNFIFGTGTAFPNPSLRSFEVFHGLKRSKQDFHAIGKTCWSTNFYMIWVWRVSWWRSRTFLFFVDGEKHLTCIEICILDLKYPTSKQKWRPFFRVPTPRREHRQHQACFWSNIWIWPTSEILNSAFVYSAAAIFKIACEIKNSAIKKLTVLRHHRKGRPPAGTPLESGDFWLAQIHVESW